MLIKTKFAIGVAAISAVAAVLMARRYKIRKQKENEQEAETEAETSPI